MLKKFQEREICVHSIDCDCDICIGSEGFNYDETVFCVCSLDCECVICIGSVCFNSNSSSTGKNKCALVEDKVFDEISQRDEPALPCHCASDEVLLVPLIGHDHLVPSGIEPVTFSESLSEELSDATTLTSTMKADLETEQVGEAQVFSKSPHQNNNQQLSQFATIVMDPFASLVLGGIVRDVILWKRKSYSVGALLAATAIWLALEVYGLTFITLGSWIAMFVIAFIFLWGNIHMLLGKEPLDMSRMYIRDESALEAGTKLREWVEKSARLLFSVSAEREWFVFAGTVASLGLLSVLASHFDLLTLLYIGVLVGLTLPVVYVRYEDRIKELGQRLRGRSHTYYSAVTERCHTYYSTVAERCRTYYKIMAERAKKMKSNLQEKKMKKTE